MLTLQSAPPPGRLVPGTSCPFPPLYQSFEGINVPPGGVNPPNVPSAALLKLPSCENWIYTSPTAPGPPITALAVPKICMVPPTVTSGCGESIFTTGFVPSGLKRISSSLTVLFPISSSVKIYKGIFLYAPTTAPYSAVGT